MNYPKPPAIHPISLFLCIAPAESYVWLHTSAQIQDPLVLLDPVCLRESLLEWLPVLERTLGPEGQRSSTADRPEEDDSWDRDDLSSESSSCLEEPAENPAEGQQEPRDLNGGPPEPVRVACPRSLQPDLLHTLTQLATLHAELSCFGKADGDSVLPCVTFLRRYFFLLDRERVRRMCLLCWQEQPEVQLSFIQAMRGETLFKEGIFFF